jgi:hypothetical protein
MQRQEERKGNKGYDIGFSKFLTTLFTLCAIRHNTNESVNGEASA